MEVLPFGKVPFIVDLPIIQMAMFQCSMPNSVGLPEGNGKIIYR
jgi:hypothetical protein